MKNCSVNMLPHEEAVANYWWSLPLRSILPLHNGTTYQLLFGGRHGGSAGPDVRDAVLCNAYPRPSLCNEEGIRSVIHAKKYVGDVEFHVRSSDWTVHRHHTDPRYNNVMLHVVLLCDDPMPTMRQNGLAVPVCTLYDLPTRTTQPSFSTITQGKTTWPCQHVVPQLAPKVRNKLLEEAGLLRFEQKMHAFVEQLHANNDPESPGLATYDACLIPALAEGLGYGRNRDFFRAVGLYLSRQGVSLPEPLGRVLAPPPLDAERLHSLRILVERWRTYGLWQKLRVTLQSFHSHTTMEQILTMLRTIFKDTGLSLARTDILIINIVLPFAAAIGLLEHDTFLSECALKLYRMHPGLPSNWITRMMSAQLQLPSEPHGSCLQQGLHHIYRETCREKCCERCIASKEPVI